MKDGLRWLWYEGVGAPAVYGKDFFVGVVKDCPVECFAVFAVVLFHAVFIAPDDEADSCEEVDFFPGWFVLEVVWYVSFCP